MSNEENEQHELDTENPRGEEKDNWGLVIKYILIIILIVIIVVVVMNILGPTISNDFFGDIDNCGSASPHPWCGATQ